MIEATGHKMEEDLLSFDEARANLISALWRLDKIQQPIEKAAGFILAEPIRTTTHLPPFSQSAMDGYAVGGEGKRFQIVGEAQAGNPWQGRLQHHQAIKISTGAPIPEGTFAILPKENARETNGQVEALTPPTKGKHIRWQGEELQKGALLLSSGVLLTPPLIAVCAAAGYRKVTIYRPPTVSVIVTGKELTTPGSPLQPGQVYDTNSYFLLSALQRANISQIHITRADDDPHPLKNLTRDAFARSDVVIFTGGISAGEHDPVKEVLRTLSIRKIFYKVRQKPGKPIFCGIWQEGARKTLVFGLPGNPASVIVSFYEYVLPALRTLMGWQHPFLPEKQIPLATTYHKGENDGRLHFVRVAIKDNKAHPLPRQDSHMLSSFCECDGVALIPEDAQEVPAGTPVRVHLLPVYL